MLWRQGQKGLHQQRNQTTSKGVTGALSPAPDGTKLSQPQPASPLPLHIPFTGSHTGKDRCHFCHPKEVGSGARNHLQFPWASKKMRGSSG